MRTSSRPGSREGNYPGAQTEKGSGDRQHCHGKVLVVGLGPGGREYLTPRALNALQEAEVIIGYKTYLSLIGDLLPGKEVVSSGMRKEIDRAQEALERGRSGQIVAVVSSGDPGVYGMAGIILEMAEEEMNVEIIPGVTAATSAAAVLGAPLMHDFAVISLSDLLTPWSTIEKRLAASALGDFVLVLYNPRSHGREKQLEQARKILMQHKDPRTPVGIVQNAKRSGEQVIISSLEDMPGEEINMKTTVIIGNSQTRVKNGRMLTPRGYVL